MCCAQTRAPNKQEVIHPEQLGKYEQPRELRKEGQAVSRRRRCPVSLTMSVGAWFPVDGRESVSACSLHVSKRDRGTGTKHRPGWAVREQSQEHRVRGTQALSWTLVCPGDGVPFNSFPRTAPCHLGNTVTHSHICQVRGCLRGGSGSFPALSSSAPTT